MKAALSLLAAFGLTSGCSAEGEVPYADGDSDGDSDADADADADAGSPDAGDEEFRCPGMTPGACDVLQASAGGFFPSGFEVGFSAGHTCARLGSGELACWGFNGSGQLGDGTYETRSAPRPVRVQGATRHVSAGGAHTCAVMMDDDTVQCWGWNDRGQLGNGATDDESEPVSVQGLWDVQSIATGGRHTCATLLDGMVECWGDNANGQLGDVDVDDGSCGVGNACSTTPVFVPPLPDDVVEIALGDRHTCALTVLGRVLCWGSNDSGQLGDGTFEDHAAPSIVLLPTEALHVAAGGSQTCALGTGGHVRCWGAVGFDRDLMLAGDDACHDGVDDPAPCVTAPGPAVEDLVDPTAIAVGKEHACALVSGGRVRCWGANRAGQLGTDDLVDSPELEGVFRAVEALDISAVNGVAAGRLHTCAWRSDAVFCWGDDEQGQVGVPQPEASGECMSRVDTPYPCQPRPREVQGLPR